MSENPSTPDAIAVRHLTRTFGAVKAVSDLSFNVRQGEVVGFLGPNGAGKSTTLRILAGLLPATSGEAYVMGLPVANQPEAIRKRIGYMPEMNPLPEDMRVEEYLRFRAQLKELPRWVRRERVEAALELCNLQHKARRKIIGTLSKGYRQRVGIADTILAQPELVILDEPTIGLDPHQVLGIRQLIDTMRGRMTVIISSHILSEIELSCDSVIIINNGHLVAQGKPDSLRREFLPGRRYFVDIKADQATLEQALGCAFKEARIVRSWPGSEGFMRFEVDIPGEHTPGEKLIEELVRARGLALRELSFRQPRLEDVFLAATRQSWRQNMDETSAPNRKGAKP